MGNKNTLQEIDGSDYNQLKKLGQDHERVAKMSPREVNRFVEKLMEFETSR